MKYKRKVQEFSDTVLYTPEEIFPLLCPSREADWIPGWHPELIYTSSGYAENKCVFRTIKESPTNEGIWTFTGFKENEYVRIVKFQKDVLLHLEITLQENDDNTTNIIWNNTLTALTEKGNEQIESMSHDASHNHIVHLIDFYLKNGEMPSNIS